MWCLSGMGQLFMVHLMIDTLATDRKIGGERAKMRKVIFETV